MDSYKKNTLTEEAFVNAALKRSTSIHLEIDDVTKVKISKILEQLFVHVANIRDEEC